MNNFKFKRIVFLIVTIVVFGITANGQGSSSSAAANRAVSDLAKAQQLTRNKSYLPAANLLYNLGYGANVGLNTNQKIFARYLLGHSLFQLGYYQLAAFPLISVINSKPEAKIEQGALQLILKITDKIKDVSILNYAVEHLSPNSKSTLSQSYVAQKLGEYYFLKNDLNNAESNYRIALGFQESSRNSLYQLGLINLKKDNPSEAFKYFEKLYQIYENEPGYDLNKGLATLAIARTYYQGKKWDQAINYYKKIPRNHSLYRQTQMELSWAQFRDYRFRAALGTIESLQTPFYETYYDPESLILRIIIQMFICQIEDMDKSLTAFEKTYLELKKPFDVWYGINRSDDEYLNLINSTAKNIKLVQNGFNPTFSKTIPFFVARLGFDTPKFSGYYNSIKSSQREQKKFSLSALATNRNFLKFANKAYTARIAAGQKRLIAEFKIYLDFVKNDMKSYSAQFELIKYEALSTKKRVLRAKTYATVATDQENNVNKERQFYFENGFRFWPYQGEFWVDEIGNYQYLGINRCENE